MEPGPSGYSGANNTSTASNTYASFSTNETSSVETVLEKARIFRFREVDVIVGYTKQYISDKRNNSYIDASGKHFIFRDASPQYLARRKVEVISAFFESTTLELFKGANNSAQPAPNTLVGHAFEYDAFIRQHARKILNQEAIPDFLKRLGNSGQEHLHFLQKIASAMQAKTEVNPEQDGQYLLALWVELSNAMAFRTSGKKTPLPHNLSPGAAWHNIWLRTKINVSFQIKTTSCQSRLKE
ncbi:hypothetical protein [Endozoicomonas atrinae]|uniref:hypothetical protein n=1 Tax=Endozoicomonas atrinae TaxID=1333660 RepID=UPI000826392A|nr:hypothetical protein [Endozoicomonas atrinae]